MNILEKVGLMQFQAGFAVLIIYAMTTEIDERQWWFILIFMTVTIAGGLMFLLNERKIQINLNDRRQ
jgi:hypothetical protein